ncbi:hypothetical protein [Aquimarina agarivorans]|uniref:hypothetical protein n=1 Tax=Aquimarina agarivorans TaxID=980584 RepID=UPI000248EA7F|nr:hypothetical protein [Aquimarina agarivorans]
METDKLTNLKSVTVKTSGFKKSLLLSPNVSYKFLQFLKDTIGKEVVLINTNIGVQIFYYSAKNYSKFIKESMLLYTIKLNDSIKLKFTFQLTGIHVRKQFKDTVYTFSQYPRLFLAYSKKFLNVKNENKSSKMVMPFLNAFFDKTLASIIKKNGMIPFQNELNITRIKGIKPEINQLLLLKLYKEIKHHLN